MIINGDLLNADWWESQKPRRFFVELTEKAPSLLLHNLLAALEARIVARLITHYGENYGRALWDGSTYEDGDDEICDAVCRTWLNNWVSLRSYVAVRDAAELAALIDGRAA